MTDGPIEIQTPGVFVSAAEDRTFVRVTVVEPGRSATADILPPDAVELARLILRAAWGDEDPNRKSGNAT